MIKPIDSGPMRHRVTLQVNTPVASTTNQQIASWAEVNTYWAEVKVINGVEAVNADRLRASTTYEVTFRYVGVISPVTHRLVYDSRILNITAVENVDERNRMLKIQCVEVHNRP